MVEQVSNTLVARSPVVEGRPVPRVTVVVPCFKQAHYLEECLQSVFSQTYQAFEIVVVDDASPDGEEIRRVVERLGDARVRVVRHERNKGLGGSRNTGFREARTEFVLPLDADDRIAPFCLEALTAPLEHDPGLDCAYGDVQLFGRGDEIVSFPGPKPGTKLLRGQDTIPGAGTLTRRALWERVGGYDESEVLRQGREDFEFWIRAFDGGCRFEHVSRPTYHYRITHTSMNAECKLNDHQIALYIYGKHRQLFDQAGEQRLFLSHWHRRAAQSSKDRGQTARAFALAWRAWRYYPDRSRFRYMLSTLVPFRADRWLKAGELHRFVPLASYPLRGEARHRPFFVIGVGRSGNTLLRRILTAHEALHIPPETFVLGECVRTWKRHGRSLNWRDLVTLVLGKFVFHPEWSTFGVTLESLVQRLAEVPRAQRNLADVLDAFYRFHAQKSGKRPLRWGDKTPMNSLDDRLVRGAEPRRLGDGVPETLERLLRVFPDAQFVHIYRDGCDVVHSHLQGGFYTRLEDAAKRWLHVERQTRRFAREHRERSIDVRYEDLVSRPEEVVRGLCAFLGVEFEPRMLASEGQAAALGDVPAWAWHRKVGKPIDGANPGKGRRLFSRAEKEELQRWIGPELAELGYPPATLDPAGGPSADASTSRTSSP